MDRYRPCIAALVSCGLSAFSLAADAAPLESSTSAQTAYCDSTLTPCPMYGPGSISFINGQPASASFSQSFAIIGSRNLGVEERMAIDHGFLSAYASASGSATGGGNSNSVSANLYGTDLDYLTINSGAYLELPLHLTGVVDIGYSVGGTFVFSPETVFAYVSLHVTCIAGNVDSAPTTNCSQNFDYTASADVDTLLHLRIPFTAGAQFYLQVSPTLIAGLGLPSIDFSDTANISGHAIGDFADTGVFEGATVTDAFGSPLPDAVIESVSGFDYRTGFVVPEPGAVALQSVSLVALGFIRWLQAARFLAQGPSTSW